MRPKVHICYGYVDGPFGGGNQFLKALRKYLRGEGVYAEDPESSDVVLFNSFPFGNVELFDRLRHLRADGTLVLHRVDGPIYGLRQQDRVIDGLIYTANRHLADGTVFQSDWSREANLDAGMTLTPFHETVINAPNPDMFNREGKEPFDGEPIEVIATSWSANETKGFDIYRYLDENLAFDRYSMTFVGNSPVGFSNVDHVDPVPSDEVAAFLKEHDVFITASRNDTCSNSLIEALHCGLPAAVLNSGGHPEIVGDGGTTFAGKGDVVDALDRLVADYETYQANIDVPSIEEVGSRYYGLARRVYEAAELGKYDPPAITPRWRAAFNASLKGRIVQWKVQRKLRTVLFE